MIEFKNVSKSYVKGGTKALDNINLTIEQGEFVGIIGLSGAGKSTLIKTINKMIDIDEGELLVNGENVKELKGKKLRTYRHKIAMIFQSYNLVSRSSVLKNVLLAKLSDKNFFQSAFGIFTKEEKIDALTALDQVNILDKAYVRADELSGGQQQRVALARALAQHPEILLADEPVAALDPRTANMVMTDFKRINREYNISILINIHHVDLALKYTDRIIGIKEGRVVYDGPSKDINEKILEEIYGRDLTQDDLME